MIVAAVERKLKRSLSDRQKSGNTTGSDDVTVFNDTMRIHVRHKNRPDSRLAFERPADPPPPPPPPPPPQPADEIRQTAVTELFLCNGDTGNEENCKTVVQVQSDDGSRCSSSEYPVEPEQKTSILINSSPGLKTSVIIGEGGSAYAASSDNKVTISIGPTDPGSGIAGRGRGVGNYRSNVTVVDRAGSRMSEFIRMNYDPVQAARLNVTPHVCGRRSAGDTPLVSPYRVSNIEKHHRGGSGGPSLSDDAESSSESCYASAKEDASYSSTSSFSSSSSSSTASCSLSTAAADGSPHLHNQNVGYDVEPIYEEISESPTPPPLPSCPPPERVVDTREEPVATIPSRSIFEGATKYDIINYLVDAKRRCGSMHDTSCHPKFVVVADEQAAGSSESDANGTNDSGDEYGVSVDGCGRSSRTARAVALQAAATEAAKKASVDIERNDSGVGSETSQSSRSKWQQQHETQHSCEDCDQLVEIQTTDG